MDTKMIPSNSKKIAIKEYWPHLKVAEHEVISRLEIALDNLGYAHVRVDENGIRNDTGNPLKGDDVLFCLDLHVQTPKIFDGLSVGALWNPPDYYSLFGLPSSLPAQFSHDLYVSANPERSKEIMSMLCPSYKDDILPLNHSLPNNFLTPKSSGDLSLFYIGIGWDKTAGYSGRHHDLLKKLEEITELNIFGPATLADGSQPWRGFSSYKGSLPFDGTSVLSAANSAGIVLAFSSESHKAAGITSNRLFEAIAAGSLPVVELGLESPFNLDEAIQIDTTLSLGAIAAAIKDEVIRLRENLDEFRERVEKLQHKMREDFTLEIQLKNLIDKCEQVRKQREVSEVALTKPLSVIDVLAEFTNSRPRYPLEYSELIKIHSLPFQSHLLDVLKSSPSEWVSFLSAEDSVNTRWLLGHSMSDSDVLVLPGFWQREPGTSVVSLEGNPGLQILGSILLRRQIVESWLANKSGLLTITLLAKLVSLDLNSTTPVMVNGRAESVFLKLPSHSVLTIDSALGAWDRHILSLDRIPSSTSEREKALFQNATSQIVNHSASTAQKINYMDVLKALAEIPKSQIVFLVRAGFQHLRRGFSR